MLPCLLALILTLIVDTYRTCSNCTYTAVTEDHQAQAADAAAIKLLVLPVSALLLANACDCHNIVYFAVYML